MFVYSAIHTLAAIIINSTMKNRFLLLSILIVLCSCNNTDSSNQMENSNSTDTIIQPNIVQKNGSIDISDSIRNESKLSEIDRSNEPLEDVEMTESKVTFNSDFEATLSVTVKNNTVKTIVALEIEYDPGSIDPLCNPFVFQRKVALQSGKTIQIRQKIPKEENCSFTVGRVYITDFVFSDGSKQNEGDKYLERRKRQKN